VGIIDLSDVVGSSWSIRRSGTAVELLLSREEVLAGEFGESETAGFTLDVTELDAEAQIPADIVKRAQLLIVEVRPDRPASLRRLAALREENPSLAIVAAVRDTSVSSVRVLLRAGISDVLPLPFTQRELASVLGQLRAELDRGSHSTVPTGKTVAVIKSVGGVGATALLTQVAALYAERETPRGRQTCLFDLDLQSGNAATYLGVTPSMTLSELFDAGTRVDGTIMRSIAVPHPQGLQIFAAPDVMMPLEAVGTDQICDIVHLATMEYGTAFIDLPSDWTNWSLSLVARSQVVLLVVELTIASLRQAQRQLALLHSLGVNADAIQIVVNRVEKRLFKQIDLRDAATTLGRQISFSVASDFPLMNTALNRGTMLRDIQRKNAIDRDLGKIIDGIDMLLERG
jgi:pilus assembly protein CpaE